MSMSSSSGSSQSTSSTFPIETPENSIIDQIAQQAQGYASQLYDWAGSVFNQTSNITSQAVDNFFNVSSQMNGLSTNLTNQYNNLFAPENAQLVADANSYASPARMATDMGMAGATQAQAGKSALDQSEEALRSYGVNPSDGRYAGLDEAAKIQNSANIAGAENQQRMADIQTGQALRGQAVQVGAQLPAAISNVNNTAIQANTGASNAELANANTGANLYGVPDKFLSTGMQTKLPFSANKSQSTSQNTSTSSGGNNSGSKSGGGGGGGDGSGGPGSSSSGPAWMPDHSGAGSQSFSGGGGGQPQPDASSTDIPQGPDSGAIEEPGAWPTPPGGDGGFTDPPPTGGASPNDPGGDYNDGAGVGVDQGNGGDMSSFDSGGGDMARGGRVGDYDSSGRQFTGVGHVPQSASPSHGARTDDVPTRMPSGAPGHLNADEFVIPKDVALWKGQEFFQNLIDQSRKKRLTSAPAKPAPTR
jgi:hypothetical protein